MSFPDTGAPEPQDLSFLATVAWVFGLAVLICLLSLLHAYYENRGKWKAK